MDNTALAQRGVTYSDLIAEALNRHGRRVAFISEGRELTYTESAVITSQLMQLLAQRGIGRGSGVSALGPNIPELWLVQAATYLLGGRFTGLNALGSVEDHVRIVDDAEVTVLLVTASHATVGAEIAARSRTIEHLFTIGPAEHGSDIVPLLSAFEAVPLTATKSEPDDVAWLQYTGGTTGAPKGVMLTQRSMAQQVQTWFASYGLPNYPRYLAAAPITHASVLPLLPTLVRGGTVVLQQGFEPAAYLSAIEKYRINCTLAVPTMLYALLDHPDVGSRDLSSLETIAYGTAPMSPTRLVEARTVLGDVLLQGYAQTESSGVLMTLRQHEHSDEELATLKTSCGRPAVGFVVAILDVDGNEVPDGEIGEICARSKAIMAGYWKQPELTAAALKGGWLHTGDLGYRDDRGYFHIVDRLKDLVISGGFNVYPREVEDALTTHAGVATAAVIGVPHPKWGEEVTAFVVPRPGIELTADELIAHVRDRKGAIVAPKKVYVVDSLPTTNVGKIDKRALRSEFWADSDRQVH